MMFHVADIVDEEELEGHRLIGTDETHAAQPFARYPGSQMQQVKIERLPELNEVIP